MTGPGAPSATTPPPTGPGAPSGSPPGTLSPDASHRLLIVVVAIVVVVAAVVGLGIAGVVHLPSSEASTPTTSYSSAEGLANSAAASVASAPWSLYAALGADLTQGYTNTTSLPASCTRSGGTGEVSVPGYTGAYSNGEFAFWYFFFFDAARTAELTIEVSGGQATEWGVTSGAGCGTPGPYIQPVGPNVLDSTQVAAALLGNATVEAFLHNYTSANATFTLLNETQGRHPAEPAWYVQYSECGLGLAAEPASSVADRGGSLVAAVNATNGAILEVQYNHAVGCPGTSRTPIGSAFGTENPVGTTCPSGDTYAENGCRAGDYVYTLTVAQSTVNLSSVLFEVDRASGQPDVLASDGGFSVLNVSGMVVAQSSPSLTLEMLVAWTTYHPPAGPGTALTPVDTIEIDMGTSDPAGDGLQFVATGIGDYGGTTSPLPLP